ncbi:MAG: YHYH protein, partial [Candidatus Latescibacteria bacterium]|nr:YHYH protein [Candidatus Latescibacterota bacterium]
FYRRDASLGWNIEAIGTLNLGLDENQAHVQPTGSYHYHGVPWGMIANQDSVQHSALYGYAADGFPIYILYGYSNGNSASSSVKKISSSYQLRSGSRPNTNSSQGPTGTYDGTYTQDYEYLEGLGDLDEYNGRFGITPDYPGGIYHYYITDTFPFHPRSFKGTPNSTFKLGPPSGKPGMRRLRRGW